MQKRLFTLSAGEFLTVLFCAVCMTVFGCEEALDITLSEIVTDHELSKWLERYQDVDDWAVMRPPEDLSQPSVRLIYFLPNDRSVRPDRAVALCQMITDVQEFYADEMQRHGFGRKTFPVETDADDVSTENHELRVPIHELGHAFGLLHDLRGGANNNAAVGGSGHQLTHCDAAWLSVSRFFNGEPFSVGLPGDISLLSAPTHTPEGVSLRFRLADPDGLHHAQLLAREDGSGQGGILDCKPLNGPTDTVEFISSALTKKPLDEIQLQIIDVTGGITGISIFTDQ